MHQGGVAPRRTDGGLKAGTGITAAVVGAGALLALGAGARWLRSHRGLDLRGRVGLVTGGSRGLGLAIAEELVRRGARVAIMARNPEELAAAEERLKACGGEVLTVAGDVAAQDDAWRAVQATAERFGGLDLLVNNAGIMSVGPLDQMSEADFREAMDIHFWGPLRLVLAALPHLEASGGGRVVNITSIGGRIAVPHMAPYSASKFALVGLSDALASELKPRGVRVTTVCPGLMRTGSHLHARFKGDARAEATWFTASAVAPLVTTAPGVAARKIIEAARRGDPYLSFNGFAWAALRAEGLAPGLLRRAAALAARALPRPEIEEPEPSVPGWRQPKAWIPGRLRRRSEQAARDHLQEVAAGAPGGA